MSSELNITSGGAIAVDSEAFREVGRGIASLAARMTDAASVARRARHVLLQIPDRPAYMHTSQIGDCANRLERFAASAASDSSDIQHLADVFELIELRVEQGALAVGASQKALAVRARIDALIASDPAVEGKADALVNAWRKYQLNAVKDQPWDGRLAALGVLGAMVSPAFLALLTPVLASRPVGSTLGAFGKLTSAMDRGVLAPGTRLQGGPPAVRVTQISSRVVGPALGLKSSLERVPYGSRGQIVIEKYTMKNGSTRFVTYIDGTRETKSGTKEPWDMASNLDMYLDRKSAASQQATLQALAAAGANPGDSVDLVGYSQGGMISSFIAMDSPYDVGTVIVVGDPVDPSLAADQTLVRIENHADPVNALATGGHPGGTGSPGSFTVQRDVPRISPTDPHGYESYVETAALADASGDARVRALHESFYSQLREAVSVERMEFSAKRG